MSSEVNWTRDQKQAIEKKGGSMIVSAAAGSGKTAVLVERVIRLLTDEKEPIPPERLLIVTFTRAAAAEMKHKIKAALKKKAVENQSAASALQNLDRAIISTMDAFCVKLVRENFEAVGASPDFRMADDSELAVLEKTAMSAMLEEFYADGSESFFALMENFISGRDDRRLEEVVGQLYRYSGAYPCPQQWRRDVVDTYRNATSPEETAWGRYICDYLTHVLKNCLLLLHNAVEATESDEELAVKYAPGVYADRDRFQEGLARLQAGADWATCRAVVSELSSLTRLNAYRGKQATEAAATVKDIRAQIKSITEKCLKLVDSSAADFAADLATLRPVAEELMRMTDRYAALLLALKKKKNVYYFDDILHFAIDLLYDASLNKTKFCEKLSSEFDAVLIDEYQDTTRAQDALFTAISKDGKNLFVVGDVKQSIYGFRLATPDVFIEKCRNARVSDENIFPARVILSKNFRSRAGILDFVNFVFRQIMSETAGGVTYNEEECLYYGGVDAGATDDVDLLITEGKEATFADECETLADYINRTVLSGKCIAVKGEVRPVQYGDFCILLRSVSGRAQQLAEILYSHHIPVAYEKENHYFSVPETQVLAAILNIVDNPLNDVDLLSVMCFPLYGFIPDELARLRTLCKGDLYHCVKTAAQELLDPLGEKCAAFLQSLAALHNDSLSMKTSDFVRRVVCGTDFAAMVASMPNGKIRLANLDAFVGYAKAYEQSGAVGYAGFVRYLNKIRDADKTVKTTDTKGDIENAVTVMSIHKSKGLEFPYVILADVGKRFNTRDLSAPLLTDMDFGIAMCLQERAALKKYETLPYAATKLAKNNKMIAEELRILYVALTRAAVKLVLSSRVKNLEKDARRAAARLPRSGIPDPYSVLQCTDYWQMLLTAMLRHPDCDALRDAACVDCETLPSSCRVSMEIRQTSGDNGTENAPAAEKPILIRRPFSAEQFDEIRRQIEYRYPYAALQGIPAKITASGFRGGKKNYEKLIPAKPSFAVSDTLSGAARGTAYHKFMQHCDFAAASREVDAEIRRLQDCGLLSEKEGAMLCSVKLRAFFDSPLGREIMRAETVYREFAFRIMLPVRELYNMDTDEKMLVQGVADLVFISGNKAVVVDYKTDIRAEDAYLREHYAPQLLIYKRAITQILGVNVDRAELYSLSTSKAVRVDL